MNWETIISDLLFVWYPVFTITQFVCLPGSSIIYGCAHRCARKIARPRDARLQRQGTHVSGAISHRSPLLVVLLPSLQEVAQGFVFIISCFILPQLWLSAVGLLGRVE